MAQAKFPDRIERYRQSHLRHKHVGVLSSIEQDIGAGRALAVDRDTHPAGLAGADVAGQLHQVVGVAGQRGQLQYLLTVHDFGKHRGLRLHLHTPTGDDGHVRLHSGQRKHDVHRDARPHIHLDMSNVRREPCRINGEIVVAGLQLRETVKTVAVGGRPACGVGMSFGSNNVGPGHQGLRWIAHCPAD